MVLRVEEGPKLTVLSQRLSAHAHTQRVRPVQNEGSQEKRPQPERAKGPLLAKRAGEDEANGTHAHTHSS